MLPQSVFIFNVSNLTGGQYSFELYFLDPSQAKYLNFGDYVQDTSDNRYEVISPTSLPHADGNLVTVQFVDNDVSPVEDSDYNSSAFTPGQVDVRPAVRTRGSLDSVSLVSGPDYKYSALAGWDDASEASKAAAGDRIIDLAGKEFELTFIDPTNRFAVNCEMQEVNREGIPPQTGDATLYRASPNFGFFRGENTTIQAQTTIRNRDNFLVDQKLKEIESLAGGGGTSTQLDVTYINSSTNTILKGTTVYVKSDGTVDTFIPDGTVSARSIVGIVKEDTPAGAETTLVVIGRVKDVSISAVPGDLVYIDKTGFLTTTVPQPGVNSFVSGDYNIFAGYIVENESDSNLIDLFVDKQLITKI